MHRMLISHQKEDFKWIFARRVNPFSCLSDFCKTQRHNCEKVGSTFSPCNSCPCWPFAAKNTCDSIVTFHTTGTLFLGLQWCKCVFCLFKEFLKIAEIVSLKFKAPIIVKYSRLSGENSNRSKKIKKKFTVSYLELRE